MIRFLRDFEKQRCRQLWEEAFPEDSAAFCDYYFGEKLKDNRILVREEAGEIQAMLHLNPYQLSVSGQKWRIDYIVGVATKVDCRRRGYMRELLADMFRELREEKMPFVFLMPAAKEIYLPYDFVYMFDQPLWKLKEAENLVHQTIVPMEETFGQTDGFGWRRRIREVAGWMNRWLERHYQVFAIRDHVYLERLGKELTSEGGRIDLLYDGGNMVGVYAEWGVQKPEQRLLYCEERYREEVNKKSAIMARIVNINAFLKAIRLRKSCLKDEFQILLRLHDPWIPENEGLWEWNLTKEMSWAEATWEYELEAAEVGDVHKTTLDLTIGELTEWLFGYSVPEAAVEYESMIRTLQGVFLDELV